MDNFNKKSYLLMECDALLPCGKIPFLCAAPGCTKLRHFDDIAAQAY